jgi:4-diphosphocytidyl-2-C-methyl-D-erythritol kinase
MILKSYAKINLLLKVYAKEGSLHPLLSIMDKIELYDKLSLVFNQSGKISIRFNNVRIDQKDNTVYKALMLLKQETKFKQGVDVDVFKNIPLASGLGGGSSNAAVVLKFVNDKLKLNLSKTKLMAIAFRVGSDVPSFLVDGPVMISGFGEKVESINLKETSQFLIVKPKIGVSAKQAYQYFDKSIKPGAKITPAQMKKMVVKKGIYEIMTNDLEPPVINNVESLKKLKNNLLTYNFDKVMLTGSGSAFIAFSNNKKILLKAKKELASKYEFVAISKRLKTR